MKVKVYIRHYDDAYDEALFLGHAEHDELDSVVEQVERWGVTLHAGGDMVTFAGKNTAVGQFIMSDSPKAVTRDAYFDLAVGDPEA